MYVCMYVCNASDTTVEKWCAYPSEINTKIENAHIAKEESVTFVMNGADYTVDLTSSSPEQIREATNKRREMRRNIKTTPQAKSPQEQNDWTVEPDIFSNGTQRWIIPVSQSASVCRETDEFNKASAQYVKMLGETAPLPRRVDYYESETTSSNFQSKKDEFAKAGIPTKEIWVFYGTFSDENIKRIMSEGFKVGGSQVKIKNGSAYGRGVYTATGPRAPQGYGKKTNKVILARGLVGTEGVHSKTPQDDWYLFMDGHQLLPVYVLHM